MGNRKGWLDLFLLQLCTSRELPRAVSSQRTSTWYSSPSFGIKKKIIISFQISLINNKQMLQCQPAPAQQPTKSCSSDVLESEDVDVNSLVTKPLVRSCFKEVNIITFFLKNINDNRVYHRLSIGIS
jgi:hypothetical protein